MLRTRKSTAFFQSFKRQFREQELDNNLVKVKTTKDATVRKSETIGNTSAIDSDCCPIYGRPAIRWLSLFVPLGAKCSIAFITHLFNHKSFEGGDLLSEVETGS